MCSRFVEHKYKVKTMNYQGNVYQYALTNLQKTGKIQSRNGLIKTLNEALDGYDYTHLEPASNSSLVVEIKKS